MTIDADHASAKPSDPHWSADLPDGWSLYPLRSQLKRKRVLVGGRSAQYRLLSLTLRGVIVRDLSQMKGKFPASFDTYQEVAPGDFVFCLFDVEETPRTVGLSSHHGMITGAYDVYSTDSDTTARFIQKQLEAFDDVKALKPLYRGLRNTVPRASFESLKIALPALETQRLVVRYLDNAELRIAHAIRVKTAMAELLQERRSAIVVAQLTGQAGDTAAFPGSRFRVPAHWENVPFSAVAHQEKRTRRAHLDLLSVFLDRGVIRYGEGGGQVHKPSLDLSAYQEVEVGDLVLNNQQAWRGSLGVSAHHGIVSPAYVVCSLSPGLESAWANYMFRSKIMVDQFGLASRGVGSIQRQLHGPSLRRVRVPVPPTDEQKEISTRIRLATMSVDASLDLIDREIALLREYRTRLISDVVTGKKDVRAEAASMQDVDRDELAAVLAGGTRDVDDDVEGEIDAD